MNTIIISNVHRPPLCLPYVKDMNPSVSHTPDYPFPQIGHFRCFHGHTNALKCYMTDETAFVLEDDCVPDGKYPWRKIVQSAEALALKGFEFVCLHGRGFDFSKFNSFASHDFKWLVPSDEHPWVLGTLCYVVNREGAKKFCSVDYWCGAGNIDLFVWSKRHKFCLLDPRQFVMPYEGLSETLIAENPRPFIHDRSQGSLIEFSKNVQDVYR